MELTLIEERQ